MTEVLVDRTLVKDLVETKLSLIVTEIETILKTWSQKSAEKMIDLTHQGKLPEAEVDAIALTNLLEKRAELEGLLQRMGV